MHGRVVFYMCRVLLPLCCLQSSNAWARRKLLMAGGLCLLFMGGEFAGGFLAHSLAIMTE